jgi:hypothetical protein
LTLLFGITIGCLTSDVARAQVDSYADEIAAARRELQLAKIEFRDYWQVEYPRIRRHLDAQIRLTEIEVRTLKQQIRLYWPFDRWSTGSAVTWPLQDLRTCLLDAELRLRDLRAERGNLVRFRTPEWQALELRVHDARLRVAEWEAAANAAAAAASPDG